MFLFFKFYSFKPSQKFLIFQATDTEAMNRKCSCSSGFQKFLIFQATDTEACATPGDCSVPDLYQVIFRQRPVLQMNRKCSCSSGFIVLNCSQKFLLFQGKEGGEEKKNKNVLVFRFYSF